MWLKIHLGGGGGKKPTNILIEGDNYHALSVLNYTHRKKIDIIYIDPPFNTGSKDWKYNNHYVDKNDQYRHSKWLNMMKKRLRLAKNILKQNGVLICAIDENELFHLGCMLEKEFHEYEKHLITLTHNPRGIQGDNFSYVNEFVFFIFKKGKKVIGTVPLEKPDESNFRNWGGESLRTDAKNCFYPIFVKTGKILGFGDVLDCEKHPAKRVEIEKDVKKIWPIDGNGVERKWRYARQSVERIKSQLAVRGDEIILRKTDGSVKTVWADSRHDSSVYGTKLINSILKNVKFEYPKSLWTVYDCLSYVIHDKKNSIILDFFAGSGTTGHAVLQLNKEDGGCRQFILCTNNESDICTDVCYPRLKKVIKGYLDSKGEKIKGLGSNLRYFKTNFVDDASTDQNKKKLVDQSTQMLCLKEACFEQIKKTSSYAVFGGHNEKCLAIIYDDVGIKSFKKYASTLNQKLNVYVFSLDDSAREEEFADMADTVDLKPIPKEIFNVYGRIWR